MHLFHLTSQHCIHAVHFQEMDALKQRRNFSTNSLHPLTSFGIMELLEGFAYLNWTRIVLGSVLVVSTFKTGSTNMKTAIEFFSFTIFSPIIFSSI